MDARPCSLCGDPTFTPRGVCRSCELEPIAGSDGRLPCCGGIRPEHFDGCTVGDDIAAARRSFARAHLRSAA